MKEAIVGLVGVVIGLLGAIVLQWRQSREARKIRIRDLRMEIYSEAMRHVQDMSTRLDWLTGDVYSRGQGAHRTDLPARDDVTGRLQLVASTAVWRAWSEVLAAEEKLSWNFVEVYDYQDDEQPGVNSEDPDVVLARAAYAALVAAAKSDVGL